MVWILAAMAIWTLSGAGALALRSGHKAGAIGSWGILVGAAVAAVPTALTLTGHAPASFQHAWSVPYGSLAMALDGLSALFMVPLLGLSALGAVFGREYLKAESRPTGSTWFFYNLLVTAMALVLVARNGMLFLVAWELMALVSFFLVVFHSEQAEVRQAGWIYLVATHLGSVFLGPMFIWLGRTAQSLDFDRIAAAGALAPATASLVFALALVGFGAKAGFIPLHVWLPEAHPAAPSHVSALMSGVMIKLGIYGLLRVLILLGHPPAAWGWALVAIGLSSGVLGVLSALAQEDLKRVLAYSSVENIGIIAMGLGVGELGLAFGQQMVAVLGFAGALVHVLNHAIFKGLLFLGAGAVQHATGTRRMDRLGGLLAVMPRTGTAFLVGAAAISGIPPLNGFVSEFAIFLGALHGGISLEGGEAVAFLVVLAGLALISGLAAACFTRAFGVVFLGVPRSTAVTGAHDPPKGMLWPMIVLAGLCAVLGAPLAFPLLLPATALVSGLPEAIVQVRLDALWTSLLGVFSTLAVLGVICGGAWLLRRRLLAGRTVCPDSTWGCGYAAPTPRMQYTAASFGMPLVAAFNSALRSRGEVEGIEGLFPARGTWSSQTPDIFRRAVFGRIYAVIQKGLARLRWIQHGNLQVYVLYIAVTILVLLVWKLGV